MTMTARLDTTPMKPSADVARSLDGRSSASESRRDDGSPSINMLFAAILAAVIVAAFVGFGGDAAANGPLQPASEHSSVVDTIEIYVVQPGDTLWSIATAVSVEGEDIRPLVDHLKDVAGGSSLDVGQRIVIDHATMRS
ncbi:MAG: LysM peptidoglycan-binding domain-containing protein [Acidimicrobiia bacterium]|nr:LysM peptidoglycan-binding domain-containing protein [Acidimicrobiia bacterium]